VPSLYGQVDLDAMYWHVSQDRICHPDDSQPDWTAPPPRMLTRLFGANAAQLRPQFMSNGGRADWLLGGTPGGAPDRYAQVSAFTYVDAECPPTLLMHGTHDEMTPVGAVRELQARLQQVGVPVNAAYLHHTDHYFDLLGTRSGRLTRTAPRFRSRLSGCHSHGPMTLATGRRVLHTVMTSPRQWSPNLPRRVDRTAPGPKAPTVRGIRCWRHQ
jgi:acetyl esterase/lipase